MLSRNHFAIRILTVLFLIGVVVAYILLYTALSPQVTVWEHGFKTDRVIATRYTNRDLGYNIGFQFPENPNDSDSTTLSDFMELHKGIIYQSGNYPGSELYVKFDDVTDKESANAKIQEIIVPLSKLITDLGHGVKIDVPGIKELRAAKELAAKNRTQALKEQAKSLITFVQAAQSKRLNDFQDALAADKTAWKFECKRKGDYLAIVFTRLTDSYIDGTVKLKPKTIVLAVALDQKPNINLVPGTPPDLDGTNGFSETQVKYKNATSWTSVLSFPNVTLPSQNDEDGQPPIAMSLGGQGNLGVEVNGIARPASDDRIIIGEGGGSKWNDMMSSIITSTSSGTSMFSYNQKDEEEWKRPRPGVTINVPYGLGETVYNQIMEAIAQGGTQQ